MNTRGENWLLRKRPTVCRLICILCHNFWTNYDLDLFNPSKWTSELQFCERYTYVDGWKTATYYAASFLPHYRRVLLLHLFVFNLCLWSHLIMACLWYIELSISISKTSLIYKKFKTDHGMEFVSPFSSRSWSLALKSTTF